ncbi:MAG: ABC transporter ATP-binding protein [Anaerolineae bacterium]|jgi:NitT/TauT family transport system ATP-binding protein|nr:ABC transporter ATP-binding protein [Anaerolineae bacterium]
MMKTTLLTHIQTNDLMVTYPAPDGGVLTALGPISMTVARGEFVAIVGTSGCGKSTLIRVLAGLQVASQGVALLDNAPISTPSSKVGVMFQNANLLPWRTVLDNIALPLELAGMKKSTRLDMAREIMPLLGLDGFENAYPSALSGGMAQRVALGRVLIERPEVLLLDEPFGALDALTREKMSLDLLGMWARNQQTTIMVTHSIAEAVLLADRILVFSRRPGRIIAEIAVMLPRPRRPDTLYDPIFTDLTRQVRNAIDQA